MEFGIGDDALHAGAPFGVFTRTIERMSAVPIRDVDEPQLDVVDEGPERYGDGCVRIGGPRVDPCFEVDIEVALLPALQEDELRVRCLIDKLPEICDRPGEGAAGLTHKQLFNIGWTDEYRGLSQAKRYPRW